VSKDGNGRSVVELQSCQELAQCYTSDPRLARPTAGGRRNDDPGFQSSASRFFPAPLLRFSAAAAANVFVLQLASERETLQVRTNGEQKFRRAASGQKKKDEAMARIASSFPVPASDLWLSPPSCG
jgi:hypothetical protein